MSKWLENLIQKMGQDEILDLSAALAYYTVLSLAPLLILLVSLLSFLKINMNVEILFQVRNLFGDQVVQVLETMIDKVKPRSDLFSLSEGGGLLTVAISASVVFAQLQASLNKIFGCQASLFKGKTWISKARNFFLKRAFCFGIVVVFIVTSVISLLASTILSMLVDANLEKVASLIYSLLGFFIYSILFSAIFKWVPDCKVKWRSVWKSGVITALLFIVGKSLIGSYLGQTAMASAYGAAGSLLLLLVWVYYSSLIFFIGAEVTAAINIERRENEKMVA